MKTVSLMLYMAFFSLVSLTVAHADPLCPDTSKMSDLGVNPGDLQYDIDRLALCLQRSRLLQQIDETVKKREEIRQEPLGMTSATKTGNAVPVIPAMPSLPDLPDSARATLAHAAAKGAMEALIDKASTEDKAASSEWKIQRVWGQGADMQAQLARGDTIANVKLHDVLPSGEKVSELSARGVTLDDGKTPHALKWLENTKKADRMTGDKS